MDGGRREDVDQALEIVVEPPTPGWVGPVYEIRLEAGATRVVIPNPVVSDPGPNVAAMFPRVGREEKAPPVIDSEAAAGSGEP
jgi:hypothetical protein